MKTPNFLFCMFLFLQSISCQDLDLDLQGYYQFNFNLSDLSHNEIDGIAFNSTPSIGIEDSPETCFDFNGVDSYINLSNENRDITDQVSLSAWVKTTNSKRQFVISNYNSDQEKGYFLAVDDGFALIGGRAGGFWQCISTSKVDDGQWHHIVGIIDKSSWEIWVDCRLENNLSTNAINPELDSADPLTVGKWPQGNGMGEFRIFNGSIDEIRIYDRPLIGEETQLLCDINTVSTDWAALELQGIKIVPNPVCASFDVLFNNAIEEKIEYEIYNTLGQLLKSGELNNSISTSGFNPGQYILQLLIDGQLIAVKKIIQQ